MSDDPFFLCLHCAQPLLDAHLLNKMPGAVRRARCCECGKTREGYNYKIKHAARAAIAEEVKA